MKYYLDSEFNGLHGQLLTLALVREDGESVYYAFPVTEEITSWVADHVIPVIETASWVPKHVTRDDAAYMLGVFFKQDTNIIIVADWPEDVKYFSELMITGPGTMIDVPGITFEIHRVDAYPNDIDGLTQHNAYCDAIALRQKLRDVESSDCHYNLDDGDGSDAPPDDPVEPGDDAPGVSLLEGVTPSKDRDDDINTHCLMFLNASMKQLHFDIDAVWHVIKAKLDSHGLTDISEVIMTPDYRALALLDEVPWSVLTDVQIAAITRSIHTLTGYHIEPLTNKEPSLLHRILRKLTGF